MVDGAGSSFQSFQLLTMSQRSALDAQRRISRPVNPLVVGSSPTRGAINALIIIVFLALGSKIRNRNDARRLIIMAHPVSSGPTPAHHPDSTPRCPHGHSKSSLLEGLRKSPQSAALAKLVQQAQVAQEVLEAQVGARDRNRRASCDWKTNEDETSNFDARRRNHVSCSKCDIRSSFSGDVRYD